MGNAEIAVVVPVYNRAKTVLDTLDTVAAQTLPPKRLIVVDDGSTDGTPAAIGAWISQTTPKFETIIVNQANKGAGAARNRGFRVVGDCKYVAFLDSDDRWPADFLARTSARLESNAASIAATTDRCYHRQAKSRIARRSCRGLESDATVWLLKNNSGIASCTLFRADVVGRLAGFDPTLPTGQDVEFFLRASLEGPWLHVEGEPVDFYVGFTATTGEAGNLSAKYADRQRRWVRIREHFVFRQGGLERISNLFCQRFFAYRWHKTGTIYASDGQRARAIACYHKALKYQPARVRTWLRLLALRGLHVGRGAAAANVQTTTSDAPSAGEATRRRAA